MQNLECIKELNSNLNFVRKVNKLKFFVLTDIT